MAGFVPGILMGAALMIAVYFVAKKRGYPKDPLPSLKRLWVTFRESFLALMMPVIIIGGILGGLFTPTEAAVVASLYAFVVGGLWYREFGLKDIPEIIWESVKQSVRVMFIIAVAGFFGWLMVHQSIPQQVITGLTAVTESKWVLLIIIVAVLIVLGCFLEGIAVLVITIPVFMPLIERFEIDPVQFGVIMVLCSMIGLLTAAGRDEPLCRRDHQRRAHRPPDAGTGAVSARDLRRDVDDHLHSRGVVVAPQPSDAEVRG